MKNQPPLSEAIARGSVGKEQCFDAFDSHGKICAVMAAMDHLCCGLSDLKEHYRGPGLACPACKASVHWSQVHMTMHLNDTHRWSFSQIVDFLAKHGL